MASLGCNRCTSKLASEHKRVFVRWSVFIDQKETKTAVRCELFCWFAHTITEKEVCKWYHHRKWVSHRDSFLDSDDGDLQVFSKKSRLKAKLRLETVRKISGPFHKMRCIHGRYFGCLLLLIQSHRRLRLTPCPSASTAGGVLAFWMRAIYGDKITHAQLCLGNRRVHVYYVTDSVIFNLKKKKAFLTTRVRNAFHPFV